MGLLAAAVIVLAACGAQGSPTPSVAAVSPDEGWARLAPAPLALTEVAATAHDGRIWVAGGLTAEGRAVDAVMVFDPATGTWTDGPHLPEPVHHSALVEAEGGVLWLIGGYVGNGFDRPTDAVWELFPEAREWQPSQPLPEARAAGAAAYDGGPEIVYAGGVGPGGVSNAILVRDPDDGWVRRGQLEGPREHLAATSDGAGTIYVLGGRRGGLDGNLATVEVVRAGEVRRLGQLPTPRGGVAAFWWPSLGACLAGGESPGGTNPQVECITADGLLTRLPDLNAPRHGLGAAVVEGGVYVLLGGPEPGLFVSATVEAFELP